MSTSLFLGMLDLSNLEKETAGPLKNLQYARVLEKNPNKGESDIYCGVGVNGQDTMDAVAFPERFQTSFDILREAASQYPDRDHLGKREKTVKANGEVTFGEYRWTSLSYSVTTAMIIGTALISEPRLLLSTVVNDIYLKEAKFLGIWAANCPYWLLTDYASIAYGLVTVPLYESMGDEALLKIFEETQLRTVCIDTAKLPILTRLRDKLPMVRRLILFDAPSEEDKKILKSLCRSYVLMDDLIKKYSDKVVEPPRRKRGDVATVIYTSGTSGIPKGAVHTNLSLIALFPRLMSTGNRMNSHVGLTNLSYLPLSHVYQRFVEHFIVGHLGRIGYYCGNVRNLVSDMQALKPTMVAGVPRVFSKFLDRINSGIDSKPAPLRALVRWAVRTKVAIFSERAHDPRHWFFDPILKKIREPFGGNLRSMTLGSAAMSDGDIKDVQAMLTCPISEGWGTTEVGLATLQDYRDSNKGTVGGPLGDLVFKLRSIPEMEYDARATPPRGELLVKGSGFMLGYLMRPEQTAEALDSDGWYHTGDVVELLPNKGLKIMDRARNFFKLSQGEYIAPDKLESLYVGSPFVEQIFIWGESKRSHIVGIIVVNGDYVASWAASHGKAGAPMAKLLTDADLIKAVQDSLKSIAETNGLNGMERLQVFTLTDEPFSVANGLMTPTFKTVRTKVRNHYEKQLEAMYAH
ncbi:long-chain acyl-CoA synthetase, putative [Babesia caballi]|uniref:Long-chain acyl-CoA synthetase, putative n=1 Tax=Babesia caballi TaxID=5871 RepID=A0AAV4LUS4_BABCB|nr:long-chain acyl-CoA synthetase, putative [Babesia caballi]